MSAEYAAPPISKEIGIVGYGNLNDPTLYRPKLVGLMPDSVTKVLSCVPEALSADFNVDPIVDSTYRGLGEVCLRSVRWSGEQKLDQAVRTHRLYSIENDGFKNALEITDPPEGEPKFLVISLPGYTETIENDFRQKMQSHLSYIFPDARIASIATNGIGVFGGRYGWRERKLHGFKAMAEQRLKITKAIGGQLPVFALGTSMGAVISHRMARANLENPVVNDRLDLKGLFWISPALIPPTRIVKDMDFKFLPQLAWDISKEIAFKTSPAETLCLIGMAKHYGLKRHDFTAIVNQLLELHHSTSEADIANILTDVPTVMVAGANDSLAQWPMMHRLERQFDGHLQLYKIEGRGHSLAMKPDKLCDKLARAGRALIEQAMSQNK